jgi:Ca-activated chloride channel family protein
MPGEVNLTVRTNKHNFPVTGARQLVYVLLEAMPTDVVASVQMPLNFSLVLDQSGSMSGSKLRDMKAAAQMAVDMMGPQDIVSIVTYDETARILVPAQTATDPDELHAKIDSIQDLGGTKISAGMQSGMAELAKNAAPERVNRMLLLTDGQTYEDEHLCQQLARDAGAREIQISAFGLGDDWNQELLDQISQSSGGLSGFLDDRDPQQIADGFREAVASAQAAVVQNARLVLHLVSGVTPKHVWQVLPQITRLGHRALSDRDVQIYLGDIEKGQGRSAVVEMTVPSRPPGQYRVAHARLEYEVPALGLRQEATEVDVILGFTGDPRLAMQQDGYVMNIVEKVTAFKLQTRALDEAQAGNIAGATQKLRAAATRLLELGELELAETAKQEAENLEQSGQMSSRGTKKITYATRKLTQKLDDIQSIP